MNSQHGRFPEDERDYSLGDRERHFDTYRDRAPEREWMHVPQRSHTGLIIALVGGLVVLPLVLAVGWIVLDSRETSSSVQQSSTSTRQTITAEQRSKWLSLGAGKAPVPPAGTDHEDELMSVGACSGALAERYGQPFVDLPETTGIGAVRECLIDELNWTKG